jgi:hypothetical protein
MAKGRRKKDQQGPGQEAAHSLSITEQLLVEAPSDSPLNGMSTFNPIIDAAASAQGGRGSRGC